MSSPQREPSQEAREKAKFVLASSDRDWQAYPDLIPAIALALDAERKAGAQEACALCHCCGEQRHDGDDPCISCDAERQRVWEEAAKEMPSTWLDPILSGTGVPPLPWNGPEVESFIGQLTERLRARAAEGQG